MNESNSIIQNKEEIEMGRTPMTPSYLDESFFKLENLPNDILLKILSYLDIISLYKGIY